MTTTSFLQRFPSFMAPFLSLQYPIDTPAVTDSWPNASYYGTGPKDVFLVISCMAVMAVLRDVIRIFVMEPFARWKLMRDLDRQKATKLVINGASNGSAKGNGVANGTVNGTANGQGHVNQNGNASPHTRKELKQFHRRVLRFAEQGWSVIYYTLQWSYGLYIHRNLPTRTFDLTDLWLNYPHTPLAAPLKFYYLTQIAFYTHQIFIINAEARRSDHVQMMTHHVITVALMGLSYFYNFTRVGCFIMFLMDWCDIFLPLAKMTLYLNISQKLTDSIFGVYVISWAITRHALFLLAIISTYRDCPRYIHFEWAPERGRYLTRDNWIAFVAMLVALQILQIIWFYMILRIVWRVIKGTSGASDDRSDDEGGDDSDEKKDQ